jgi:hypothetical protein
MRQQEGQIWRDRCHQTTFSVGWGVPSCGRISYPAQARWAEETLHGWVQFVRLDRAGCQVRGLAFPTAHATSSLIAHLDLLADGSDGWQIEHAPADSLMLVLPPCGVREQLAGSIAQDYRAQCSAVVAAIAAGHVPADYARVWYFLLCHEAAIDPREEPTPQELVEALRLCDMAASTEAKEAASFRRWQARRQRRRAAWARHQAWRERHLLGLVPTSIFPASVLRLADPSHSLSFGCDPVVTYFPFVLEGGRHGYLASCGERWLAYVVPAVAEGWYQERWQEERSPAASLALLAHLLRPGAGREEHADYWRWVVLHEGEEALVERARAGAPIEIPARAIYPVARASKVYRIALAVRLDEHEGGHRVVGYGVPGLVPEAQAPTPAGRGAAWERTLRLYGWVPPGQEERGPWPHPADLFAEEEAEEDDLFRLHSCLIW